MINEVEAEFLALKSMGLVSVKPKYSSFICLSCKSEFGWEDENILGGCFTCGLCQKCINKSNAHSGWGFSCKNVSKTSTRKVDRRCSITPTTTNIINKGGELE